MAANRAYIDEVARQTNMGDGDVHHSAEEEFPLDDEPSLASSPHSLPQLTNEPRTLPDSCLSLSLPLLRELHAHLPPSPRVTLSIGSGTGLVEALLHSLTLPHPLNLVSVEIAPSPNRYHASHRTVPGTWALDPLAKEAKAWLFVYPKQVTLVREYMTAFAREGGVEVVMYIGPRMDWDDFREAFEGFAREIEVWGEDKMEEVGGRAWECVAIVRPEKRIGSVPGP